MDKLIDQLDNLIFDTAKNYDYILDQYLSQFTDYEIIHKLINTAKGEAQRTAAWYEKRNTCITASDIAAVIGDNKYKSARQVLTEKCGDNKFTGNMYTQWGNRYEPIATAIYELFYKVKIYEANLLIHKSFPYIGASCDGFVIDEIGQDGYLIEIKCPFNRAIIHGAVPQHYLAQPLTQMEVAKVSRCAFFECKFEEYQSEADFIADSIATWPFRGIYLEIITPGENPKYIYPDLTLPYADQYNYLTNEAIKWEISSHRFIWYRLTDFSRTFIPRNKIWFKDNLPYIRYFWKQVEYYREVGYENIRKIILNKKNEIPNSS